jgi:hypothetical protein
MGQEEVHTYRFPCTECGEEMAVTMHVDYERIASWVEEAENAEPIEEDRDCKVVNLHANFVIPEEYRHQDMAFPHMFGMQAMLEKAMAAGATIPAAKALKNPNSRPYRRPDFDAEWKKLKRAWSLHRRGKDKLADRIREEASSEFYENDPLDDVVDWVWRFGMFSTGIDYEPKFRAAMETIAKPLADGRLDDMLAQYNEIAAARGEQYHSIIRDYFAAWSEFSQVHFSVGSGVDTQGLSVGTSGFASTQMYYGNAFETLASSVDILVMVNNVLSGRSYDQLSSITLAQYRATDKGKRFDALAGTPQFAALCDERDNQLRNASHHRELKYDQSTGTVQYTLGKGGAGGVQTMPYAEYLTRCSRLHHQIIVLLRIELIIAQNGKVAYPV